MILKPFLLLIHHVLLSSSTMKNLFASQFFTSFKLCHRYSSLPFCLHIHCLYNGTPINHHASHAAPTLLQSWWNILRTCGWKVAPKPERNLVADYSYLKAKCTRKFINFKSNITNAAWNKNNNTLYVENSSCWLTKKKLPERNKNLLRNVFFSSFQ